MILIGIILTWVFFGWQIALAFFIGALVNTLNHQCPECPPQPDPPQANQGSGMDYGRRGFTV